VSHDLELLRAIFRRLDVPKVLDDFPGMTRSDLVDFFRRLRGALPASGAGCDDRQGAVRRQATDAEPWVMDSGRPTTDQGDAPPRPSRAILYTDGGSRGNPGPAGYGFALLDPGGATIDEGWGSLGVATNNVAEYRGVIAGLEKALELGTERIELCSDSDLLIKQIHSQYRVKSPALKPLHREVMSLLGSFREWRARHVPREENAHADMLANRAMDEAKGA